MVNLMSNNNSQNPLSAKKEDDSATKEASQPKPVNLERYHDEDGLSVTKMEIGLFWIKNRVMFRNVFFFILAFIGIVTWSVFFYTFGNYLIFGIRSDNKMAANIVETKPISHEETLKQMPKNLIIEQGEIMPGNSNRYDLAASVTNPNERHWASVEYFFQLDSGKSISQTSFILPGETKLLAISGAELDSVPTEANLVIAKTEWIFFNAKTVPDYKAFSQARINFLVEDKKFTPAKGSILSEKLNINNLEFNITNKSDFNYWAMPLQVIIRTSTGLGGVKSYVLEKFNSGDKRFVSISFPGQIGLVREIEIVPDLNIFDKNNYMDFKPDQPIKPVE